MSTVKKSITLPKGLDLFVISRAKSLAKTRGKAKPNYSEAIAELIVSAKRQEETKEAA